MFISNEDLGILSQAVAQAVVVPQGENINAQPEINERPFVFMDVVRRNRINNAVTHFNDSQTIQALNEFIQILLNDTDQYLHLFAHENHAQTLSIIYQRAIRRIDEHTQILAQNVVLRGEPDQETARRTELLHQQRNCLLTRMAILSEARQEYSHQLANKNRWRRVGKIVVVGACAVVGGGATILLCYYLGAPLFVTIGGGALVGCYAAKKVSETSLLGQLLQLEAGARARIHATAEAKDFGRLGAVRGHFALDAQIRNAEMQRDAARREAAGHAAEIQRLVAENENRGREVGEQHAAQVQRLTTEIAERARQVEAQIQRLRQRDAEHAVAMEQRDEQHAAAMGQRDAQHLAEIERINVEHLGQIRRLTDEVDHNRGVQRSERDPAIASMLGR